MLRPVSLLVALVVSASAFSWNKPKAIVEESVYPTSQSSEAASVLEVEGLSTLIGSLDAYERKPDCFRHVAGHTRARCGEFDVYEDERVTFAISLTICELRTTRHQSIPLECAPFAPEKLGDAHSPVGGPSRAECVEALSRSAQYWSSYSGYLREVPQLCYAFRRWNDIDTAKDIYRNATLEKVALIQHLAERERRTHQITLAMESQVDNLRGNIDDMRAHINTIPQVYDSLAERHSSELHDTITTLATAFNSVARKGEERSVQLSSELDVAFHRISEQHSAALLSALVTMENSLATRTEGVFTALAERESQVMSAADDLAVYWRAMREEFVYMQESITSLIDQSSTAADHLSTHLTAAHEAHAMHLRIASSSALLDDTLRGVTERVQADVEGLTAEMAKLNQTAAAARDSFSSSTGAWGGTAKVVGPMIETMMYSVLRMDPGSLQWVLQVPAVQTLVGLTKAIMVVAQIGLYALSSLMSAAILIASRNYLPFRSRGGPSTNGHCPSKTSDQAGSMEHDEVNPDPDLPAYSVQDRLACAFAPAPPALVARERTYPGVSAPRLSASLSLSASRATTRFSRIPDRLCLPQEERW